MKQIAILLLSICLISCGESESTRNERIKTAIQDSLNVDLVKMDSASINDLKILKVEEVDAKHFAQLKAKEVTKEIEDWEQIKRNWEMEVENYEVALQILKDTTMLEEYSKQMDTAKQSVARADAYLASFRKKLEALKEEEQKADAGKTGGYIVSTSFALTYYGATDTVKVKYLVSDKMDVEVYPEEKTGARPESSYTPK